MRFLAIAALAILLSAALGAAPALEIVSPVISQMEGGEPEPPGFEHVGGETLFFSCRVSGFTKGSEDKIRLAYSVQAFDPKGVPVAEVYKNEISSEVLPQDKEWQPKIELAVPTPPLVPPGAYKIVVKVDDLEAKTSAELTVPFRMRGPVVEPSDKLVVRAFRFYTAEDNAEPMAKAAYHVGDDLWAKFDITGFKYGSNNKVDISYAVSILSATGAVLWKQPEPALEQSESFYPKPYVQASMNLNLKTVKPAEYTMLIQVKDAVGNQTCEIRQTFTVQ
jgi:hypothetical protein